MGPNSIMDTRFHHHHNFGLFRVVFGWKDLEEAVVSHYCEEAGKPSFIPLYQNPQKPETSRVVSSFRVLLGKAQERSAGTPWSDLPTSALLITTGTDPSHPPQRFCHMDSLLCCILVTLFVRGRSVQWQEPRTSSADDLLKRSAERLSCKSI